MPATNKTVSLALVDDHTLFRKGLISLIEMVGEQYSVLFEADNGVDMQQKIDRNNLPDIVLMDISMPGMDGFECVQWLRENYPQIRVLVISMVENEETVVRMLKQGVKGYLCKDVEPREFREALHSIINKGYYYTDFITGKLVYSLQHKEGGEEYQKISSLISDREKQFLEMACSEMTYSEIASKMYLSPKTIDGYRDSLFAKLNVRSRVGLALYAVKHGLVKL
jgi:two-component system, NarL family, invasion response regulator UvrY